jgi:hypothetical protein
MSQEGEEGSGRGGLTWVWVLVFVPVLYVLSIGPVIAITQNKPAYSFVRNFYAPVIWLHNNTVLKGPLEMYAKLWGWK